MKDRPRFNHFKYVSFISFLIRCRVLILEKCIQHNLQLEPKALLIWLYLFMNSYKIKVQIFF